MIPYFDYRPEYRRLRAEIDGALARVLESGRLILGPEVEAFEAEFAAWAGAGTGVGVASGTDAISLSLRALGIGDGDEVITVANAGVPPVAAIRAAGARPVFVDVDDATLQIDPSRLESARSERTRCVLPVHLYGHPAPLEPILEFARRHGLAVVEDCAHAHGALYRGKQVGTFGDVGCFSFYPTKVLGAYGDGGLCLARESGLAERIRLLRMYGLEGGRAGIEGLNSRLDELQAAILRVKLGHLDESLAERRGLARRYVDRLGPVARRHAGPGEGLTHAYHLFVVRVEGRSNLLERLDRKGIGYGLHYPEPVHRMEAYATPGAAPGELPVTERACGEVLSLPLYPGLPPEAVDRVARFLADPR